MMNVDQMLDMFGLNDPRMGSRDAGIGLMILLLMMSACLEGSKPIEVGREDWTRIPFFRMMNDNDELVD